jgi:hypothetical protein
MAIPLKQSTASQEVPIGPFVDSTDGVTAETALTISNTDIKIWKSGATTLADKNSGGATHIANGVYYMVLDATDTDTLGPLVIFVSESGALPCKVECVVLAANIFDSGISATDKPEVDVVQIGGSNVTAAAGIPEVKVASLANDSITASVIAANAIDAASIAADAITSAKIQDGALTAAKLAADAITAAKLAADVTTELQSGLATAAALATVDTVVDAIQAKTDSLTFTQAGHVDANVQRINDVAITGDGAGTPFGV